MNLLTDLEIVASLVGTGPVVAPKSDRAPGTIRAHGHQIAHGDVEGLADPTALADASQVATIVRRRISRA